MGVSKMTTIIAATRNFFTTLTYKKSKGNTYTEIAIEVSPSVENPDTSNMLAEAFFHILVLGASEQEKQKRLLYLEQYINASDKQSVQEFWDNLHPAALTPMSEQDLPVTVYLLNNDGSLNKSISCKIATVLWSLQHIEKELFFAAFHTNKKQSDKKTKPSWQHEHKRLTHKYFLHHTI